MKAILELISESYKSFTPTQQKVAEYLCDNLSEAILINSTQISKNANVSEATLTRVITSLGFSSLSEFKRKVGQQLLSDFWTTRRSIPKEKYEEHPDRDWSIYNQILEVDIENIRNLTVEISAEIFKEALDRLCSARKVYVLGLRASYALSFFLAFNLRYYLNSVTQLTRSISDIPEQVLAAGKNDVLVSISFKQYTREVVEISEGIKRKGTYVISITDSHLSPIAQLGDLALIVKTKIPTYIDSFSAPMCLINVLIASIAIKKKDKALLKFERLRPEFEAFKTYIR